MLTSHQWSPESHFTASVQATILCNEFENYSLIITATSPRGQWVHSVWPSDAIWRQTWVNIGSGNGLVPDSPVLWISPNSWVAHRTTHDEKLGRPNHFLVPKLFWLIFKIYIYIFSCDQAALWMVFSVCPSVCLSVCLSVRHTFLTATKQLYEWFSPSVCLSHLFDYVPIILSSWNFQELLPVTKVTSMQKVKVKGQGHRGHDPT